MFDPSPTDPCETSIATAALNEAHAQLAIFPPGPARSRLAAKVAHFEATLERWALAPPTEAEQRAVIAGLLDFCAALEEVEILGAECATYDDVAGSWGAAR